MSKFYLGIDPGFAKIGLAAVEHTADGQIKVLGLGVIETRGIKGSSKTVDAIRRLTEITEGLERAMAEGWLAYSWDCVVAEAMSHVRSASASTKVGMAWGALTALCYVHSLPLLFLSPQKVRRAVVGVPNISKEAVQMQLELDLGDLSHHLATIPKGKRNHAYDALAVVVAYIKGAR